MASIGMLTIVFAQVALGAFGGGLATIPFIHRELVQVRPWLTETMFTQTLSLAQMTPGPVALNSATFVGFRLEGVWGAFFASLALVGTPILVLALLLWLLSKAPRTLQGHVALFQKALRPAVAGLLLVAFWTLAKPLLPHRTIAFFFQGDVWDLKECLLLSLTGVCFVVSRFSPFKQYPQLLILFAALVGVLFKSFSWL